MKLLIIEDDLELCSFMKFPLKAQGFEADFCHDGNDAFLYASQSIYDVILLDRMLPGMDGMTILSNLRRQGIHTPVIMVTALNSLKNRIDGLEGGADDYITKPFVISELIARIRAQARRTGYLTTDSRITYGDLTLDCDLMEISCGTLSCPLSKREYDLLLYLLQNQGRILTRQLLLDRIWGLNTYVTEGNIDNFIFFLRKRLTTIQSKVVLKNIRGVGYRLEYAHD